MLEAHIEEFGIDGKIVGIRPGPVVTIYEFEPGQGVRTAKITDIAEDLKVRMAAEKVRIAHISGTSVIGIELPNLSRQPVLFRPLVENEKFENSPFAVPLALGVNVSGDPFYFDLTKMIHLLIAGHTGTGKSVFVQSIIMSLLYKFRPDECKLIIIDPKGLDFGVFDDIAHLMCPIIKNDPAKSVNALKWAVREMDERYAKMQQLGGVLKISEYNEKIESLIESGEVITRQVPVGTDPETGALEFETQELPLEKMPYLVLIVDEVADLMSLARKEVEACVQRLAAKARAAGIHLVLATQRPDTSVITGTIKANFPARISFQAFSSIDSKTSLGQTGAEQLLPFGDMLLSDNGKAAVRVHTPLVSHSDMKHTCDFIKKQAEPEYVDGIGDAEGEGSFAGMPAGIPGMPMGKGDKDADMYRQAVEYVVRDKKPTISYVQRRLGVGYNKAAGFIERMEREGIVSAPDGNNKRHIL
jgi:S-DNA-T family DNA segregation ATPase FtsK/SpoIIIE